MIQSSGQSTLLVATHRFFTFSPVLTHISRDHARTAVDHILHEPTTKLLLYPEAEKFSAGKATEYPWNRKEPAIADVLGK